MTTAGGSAINSQRPAGHGRESRPDHRQPEHLASNQTTLYLQRPGRARPPRPTPTAPPTPTPTTSWAARPATPSPPWAPASTAPSAGSTTAYDSAGNPYLFTSYDAASGGNVVNQVEDVYNGLGQLTGEYQAHAGAVDTSTTPEVQYTYTEMAGGQNNSRPDQHDLPQRPGRSTTSTTPASTSAISRVSALADDSGTPGTVLESYTYLGLDTIVERDHPQTGVEPDLHRAARRHHANTDGGDQYTGLDRFGRVIDQNWVNTEHADDHLDRPVPVRLRPRRRRALPGRPGRRRAERALPRQQHRAGDDSTAYDALGRLTGVRAGRALGLGQQRHDARHGRQPVADASRGSSTRWATGPA